MNRYSSSTLSLFINNCPRALQFHRDNAPHSRDHFAAGVAAHAMMQAAQEHANREDMWRPSFQYAVGDKLFRALVTEGRSFRGRHEPPLPPDSVKAGIEIAQAHLSWHEPTPGMEPEIELHIDDRGAACPREQARWSAIFDGIRAFEVGDEEWSGKAVEILEYKTAWPTGEGELDTIQGRGQVALARANYPDVPIIRQRVVNLRTGREYVRDLFLDDERDTIDGWLRDILALCDAADKTQEARPGLGCASCPYWASCDAVLVGARSNEAAQAFAVAAALRDAAAPLAREQASEAPVAIDDGYLVGYRALEGLEPGAEAVEQLLTIWGLDPEAPENDAVVSLLRAMKLGKAQFESAIKKITPLNKGPKAERDARRIERSDWMALCLTRAVRREFSVWKEEAADG